MLPQYYCQTLQVCICKIIDDHKKSLHNTKVTPSSFAQLMMINNMILFQTMTLSTTPQTRRMRILCGNSSALFHTRDYLSILTLTINDLYLSLQIMILSNVLCMLTRTICCNRRDVYAYD